MRESGKRGPAEKGEGGRGEPAGGGQPWGAGRGGQRADWLPAGLARGRPGAGGGRGVSAAVAMVTTPPRPGVARRGCHGDAARSCGREDVRVGGYGHG